MTKRRNRSRHRHVAPVRVELRFSAASRLSTFLKAARRSEVTKRRHAGTGKGMSRLFG